LASDALLTTLHPFLENVLQAVCRKLQEDSGTNGFDEDHAATTLAPPLQLGATVTTSLCITAAHCHQSTISSNGPRILPGFSIDSKASAWVKVKLFLFLTKHHAMKTYWGSEGISLQILKLGTRWR
jgi:hypothetical protein